MTGEDGISDDSEDWLHEINRRGLKHVSSCMYMVVVAIELVLKERFQTPELIQTKLKKKATDKIMENEDVLFHWALRSAGWEIAEEQALLPLVIDMWVTMRGFSFASAWVERHKHITKRILFHTAM